MISTSTSPNTPLTNHPTFLNLFPVKAKAVELQYSGEKVSSDGGLLLLKEVENKIGIIDAISSCINDDRDQRYVEHTIQNIVSQRVYQIAAGYEDGNDCNELKDDAILKLCSDKLPESDKNLGSQSTISRFENSLGARELYRIAEAFVINFIKSYESEPKIIIFDADDTNNTAHGQQLEIEYNAYYGEYVFMPLHIYEGLSGKLITTILKPGRRSKSVNVFAILKRIIKLLRQHWKDTIIVLRGDSHFHCPELTELSNTDDKLRFVTGLTGNPKLYKLCATTIESAEREYKRTGNPVKFYHSFIYQAKTWKNAERVIVKVEMNERGKNIRFIATNLHDYRAKSLYEVCYCSRGNMELMIKEHKTYLKSDRTSCTEFFANQMRMFLHSAAYVLIHSLQKEVLRGTKFANATMKTIQLKLIKTAAIVKELKTKIKIEFPRTFNERQTQVNAFNILEKVRWLT